jgi:hypothetical protein
MSFIHDVMMWQVVVNQIVLHWMIQSYIMGMKAKHVSKRSWSTHFQNDIHSMNLHTVNCLWLKTFFDCNGWTNSNLLFFHVICNLLSSIVFVENCKKYILVLIRCTWHLQLENLVENEVAKIIFSFSLKKLWMCNQKRCITNVSLWLQNCCFVVS